MKAFGTAYAPMDTDLEQIGATGDYARLVTDPIKTAQKHWDAFTIQPASKQVEQISTGLTETLIAGGAGKVLEGLDVIAAKQLLERLEQHAQKLDKLIAQTSPVTSDGVALRKFVLAGEKTQLSGAKAAGQLGLEPKWLRDCTDKELRVLGVERVEEYRDTFFNAHPHLKPDRRRIVVHHAVEQDVLKLYKGLFSATEINDISNLRGIPLRLDDSFHKGILRKEWNRFYRIHKDAPPTKQEVLDYAHALDRKYANMFVS